MGTVLLFARLLLALVFLIAAVTKFADRAGSRQSMLGFGIPERFAGAAAIALPIAELILAILLIAPSTAWWGAVGAVLLLTLFIVTISFTLARGNTPDCHCFGQLYSEPIGTPTLVRNAALAGLGLIIVIFGWNDAGPSVASWFGELTTLGQVFVAYALLTLALLAIAAWFILNLTRQQGRLLDRLDVLEARLAAGASVAPATELERGPNDGLPIGEPAPDFILENLDGESTSLSSLWATGKPTLLILADPNCIPCNALFPEIGRWQREYQAALTVAVVSRGGVKRNLPKAKKHDLQLVLLQKEREVSTAYHARGTPGGILVNSDGTIGSDLARGPDAIRDLVKQVLASSGNVDAAITVDRTPGKNDSHTSASERTQESSGEPAPEFSLPDLSGTSRSLDEFRGARVVILFWTPESRFCRLMLPDLRRWESRVPEHVPKVLVISSGDTESNKKLELAAPVLSDPDFAVSKQFGVSAAPSAVLIDAEGNLASNVIGGAPNVIKLLSVLEQSAQPT